MTAKWDAQDIGWRGPKPSWAVETAARKNFRAAFRAYPLSWYSVLAYSRLREGNRKRAHRMVREVLSSAERLEFMMGTAPDGPRWTNARAPSSTRPRSLSMGSF